MSVTVADTGSYSIEVIYDCTAIPGSPIISKAYDASLIKCGPVPIGFVGKPVEFNGIKPRQPCQHILLVTHYSYR